MKTTTGFIKTFLLSILFSLGHLFMAQANNGKGYEIKVQVTPIADTVCYLANYYGNNQYLKDTAEVDSEGRFVFEKY